MGRQNERGFNLTSDTNLKIDSLAAELGISRSRVIVALVRSARIVPGDGLFSDRVLVGPVMVGRGDLEKKT